MLKFKNLYVGSGSFGEVKKAVRISDGKQVAVKIIPKRNVKNHFDMVKDEVAVLTNLHHPNVIGFYDSFESRYSKKKKNSNVAFDNSFFFFCYIETSFISFLNCKRVLPFFLYNPNQLLISINSATGGELFERLFERGKFTEKDAVVVMKSVLTGLEYLHKNNIVHRGNDEHSFIKINKYCIHDFCKLDMKPENLLFKTPESDADLVICDFG